MASGVKEVDDIYVAAYLKVRGCEYTGKRRLGVVKVMFAFKHDKIEEFLEDYWSGRARVEPMHYAAQVKCFKELCFSV